MQRLVPPVLAVALSEENGTAEVSNIPLSAFAGWQHRRLNPLMLTKVSFLALITAFEHGWLDPEGNFFTLSKYESEPCGEGDTSTLSPHPSEAFSTVFVAAMEATLNHSDGGAALSVRGGALARVKLSVASVGNSSFGLRICVTRQDECGTPLGSVIMSFVHVDFAARRPAPLPAPKRTSLERALVAFQSASVSPISAGLRRLPLAAVVEVLEHSAFQFEKSFPLRQADFDFNLHLNQSMYQSFALDALKDALVVWAEQEASADCDTTSANSDRPHESGAAAPANNAVIPAWFREFLAPFQEPAASKRPREGISADGSVLDAEVPVKGDANSPSQKLALQADARVSKLRVDYHQEIRMPPSAKAAASPPVVICSVAVAAEENAQGSFYFKLRLGTDDTRHSRAMGVITVSLSS